MGVHGQDWAQPVLEQIVSLPNRHGYQWFEREGGLTDHVDIVPVTFDECFTDLLTGWSSSSVELAEFANRNRIAIPNVLGWLENAGDEEKNFFWSHLVDVLLYRFINQVRAEVRLRLRRVLVEAITARMAGGNIVEASVLAHSLGTSIVHDSLALLGSEPIDGNHAFMVGSFQFANLFMVANVSRILETIPSTDSSVVHPATINPQQAYCQAYYNFRHTLDPFPSIRPFEPWNWGDDFITVTGLNKIRAFNVHGFQHYLEAPQVHVPILRGLFGNIIEPAEEEEAIRAYDALPEPPCVQELRDFKLSTAALIRRLSHLDEPEELIKAGSHFLAVAKRTTNACLQ
jgi:hypothetical protein